MRVTTWNVNGLRAALKKGFPEVIERLAPDVLLLQEVRTLPEQLPDAWRAPEGWHVLWHPAEKLGYAGTAIWSRTPLEETGRGLGEPDPEGRVLRARTLGVEFASVYLPSGSSGEARQVAKEAWMARFLPWISGFLGAQHPLVWGGDLNIAHTENDIWNPKGNAQNSGFLPHERAWMGDVLASGWHDLFRTGFGERQGPYSWWSNRGQAREKDRGWRIDYLLAGRELAAKLTHVQVDREAGTSVSDHAPVSVDFAL